MSTTTPVTISGTFSKDSRPSNGLEEISDQLISDQLGLHYVVGVVQFAGASVPGPNEPLVPRVKFLGIEPLAGGAAEDAKRILDEARKSRGLGRMEESIPAPDAALFEFDGDGHPTVVDHGGGGGGETRLGPDGEHVVAEASAEELLAERAEAAKASVVAATAAVATKDKATKAKPTTTPFTPDGDAA
jgi:hypothetical protein